MTDRKLRQRQNNAEDMAAVIAILRANDEILSRIARAGFVSREQVVTIAIQHFGSLPLKEQWQLTKKYL